MENRIRLTGDIRFRGITDYEKMKNLPKINGVELIGDKSAEELSLQGLLIEGENVEIVDNEDGTFTINVIGSGGNALEADLEVSNPLGRYSMGDIIDEGTTFEKIFRGILSKTYYPSLVDPSASLTYLPITLLKVGSTVPQGTATLTLNRGSINPAYGTSGFRSGEATNYHLATVGADNDFQPPDQNHGRFDIPALKKSEKGVIAIIGHIAYSEGEQPYDSDGEKYNSPLPSGTKAASKQIEFIYPFFYGKKQEDILSDLTGLTEDLTKKSNKTYSYVGANNDYLYFVYDSSYGDLTSLKDENDFENIQDWTKNTMMVDGYTYNVYKSKFAITGSPSFIFKF